MPSTFLFFGILSISLLILTNRISEEQDKDSALHEALMSLNARTSAFHLWFEEAISGDEDVDMRKVWLDIDTAIYLSEKILDGGELENYRTLEPLKDSYLRSEVGKIKSLLTEFKAIGLRRHEDPKKGAIGSALDQDFDDLYMEIESKVKALEKFINKGRKSNRIRMQRLFWVMVAVWTSIVMGAVAGLLSRELRQKDRFLESQMTSLTSDKRTDLRNLKSFYRQISMYESPLPLVAMASITIVLTEIIIMLFLPSLSLHSRWLNAIVDGTSLILLLLPAFYFLWFQPMRNHILQLVKKDQRLQTEICEHKLTEEALQESERQLRFLSSRLLKIQETERRRISRELHDELGGGMATLKLWINYIKKKLRADQQDLTEECEKSNRYIDRIIEDIHRLSWNLSPSALQDLGLPKALRWLVNNIVKSGDVKVTLDIKDADYPFSQSAQITLYRIFQEALTNIVKNAQAKNITLTVHRSTDAVSFIIGDDGKGFDLRNNGSRNARGIGMGLGAMHDRAETLGAAFKVWSQEGKGTRITLQIPIKEEVSGNGQLSCYGG